MPPRIIDPYREFNEETRRWVRSLSDDEYVELLKEAGILDKNGKLAAFYRAPEKKPVEPTSSRSKKARRRSASTPPPIIDPYREFNEDTRRWVHSLSKVEFVELLKEAGILNKKGTLAALYRPPAKRKPAKPRLAKPKSARTARSRKRSAS